MARVKAFRVDGVVMTIPSGDHEPAHIHARRPGEWEAKVYIRESADRIIELIRPPNASMKNTHRRAIIDGVESFRNQLLEEWDACQAG